MLQNLLTNSKALMLSTVLAVGLVTSSCGSGTSAKNIEIPGVQGMKVQLLQDNVLISLVAESVQLEGGLRYNIPKYPNSYLEISPDLQSAGTLLAISVSLDDIFSDTVKGLDALTLPGGRPLPGVATGSLPAVAFSIEKFKNMAFYLGPKVFGVFIPLNKLGIGTSIITARYYSDENRVGNISLVGEDANGQNAGILLLLDMSSAQVKQLKSLSKKY